MLTCNHHSLDIRVFCSANEEALAKFAVSTAKYEGLSHVSYKEKNRNITGIEMNLNTISLQAVTLILYNQEFQTLVDKRVVYINADPSALFFAIF